MDQTFGEWFRLICSRLEAIQKTVEGLGDKLDHPRLSASGTIKPEQIRMEPDVMYRVPGTLRWKNPSPTFLDTTG
jgi:hypothetical protein